MSLIAGDFNDTAVTSVVTAGSTGVCVDINITDDDINELNEEFCVNIESTHQDLQFHRATEACDVCVTIMEPPNAGIIETKVS